MSHVSGRSGRTASSSATFKLPPLSPAFLTEEDAAYWVHTRIPLNPDKEYGSVILLRPDGKLLATSPIAGQATGFDFGTIVQTDVLGGMLHPLGYRCVASVHSHPPIHAEFRNGNRRQDETLLRLFMSFYSGGDFIGDVSARDFFRSAYLSGPDGSLLKYVSSGSPEERDYFLWQQSGGPSGHPAGAYDVMAVINKLATVGELKVIVSNADWGYSVGRVPAAWKAGASFSKGVVTELPLMTRVCVNAERAVLAALKSRGAQTTGLILKKLVGEEYVATHARPAGLAAWDPERIFPVDAQGQLQLPRGYLLEGFYFASRPDPAQFPPAQRWLYENFFTPREFAWAIEANARSQHLAQAGRALSLYMRAQDHAMLKYRFSGDSIEAALSVTQSDGTVSDNGVQARLLAGTLDTRAFVSMLVLAGTLEVVRGSALWAHLGPVGLQWQPFANFPWPRLSRAFLAADDAVRHAHELVGIRRDQQHAGYVFQRSDKRFVVTEPLPGDIDTLSQGRLYPLDNHGRPVFPDDHTMHARYVAHVALSQLDPVHIRYLRWTRAEALLDVQMLNVDELRQTLLDGIALYCSGAGDSLIRFQPYTTIVARELARRLGTGKHPGELASALRNGTERPQAFVREQAQAGVLFNLIDHALWGYRGQIGADWSLPIASVAEPGESEPPLPTLPKPSLPDLSLQPYPPTQVPAPGATTMPWKRPARIFFGAVFSSADEAALSQSSTDVHLHDEKKTWFGFILKHVGREEYIASELIPVSDSGTNLFRQESVFSSSRTAPWYQYPDGFDLHAVYYMHQRIGETLRHPQDWLAHYFVTPETLTVAMYLSERRPVVATGRHRTLYIATGDGALLRYVFNSSSKLFYDDSSQTTLQTLKDDLAAQRLLPSDFVHTVVDSGQLDVLRTSLCWDRPGLVKKTWQPYANLQRRALGPVFHSADDAAVHARSLLPQSTGKLYGGVILKRSDGLYVATSPIEVTRENFDSSEIIADETRAAGLFPENCRIVARYRSRVPRELSVAFSAIDKQIYLNMLSVDTLYSAFTRKPVVWDEYLFAPDGATIRYQPGLWERLRADLSIALTASNSLPASLDGETIKQRLYSSELKPIDWIDSLARTGYLQVVTGSDLWGLPRQVSRWVPFSADLQIVTDYSKAATAAVCGPLFLQADAAARYVHELAVSRDTQTFGVILRSDGGVFLASLPLTAQRSALALDRIFEHGRLPSGFLLDSIYLRAVLPPLGARPRDIRHVLIMPSEVQQACRRASTPQGYKPIYFSCADGALLRLQLHAFEPGTFFDRFGQVELRPNAFVSMEQAAIDERNNSKGTFSLVEYVNRMARAGDLHVIETSACWSRRGRVEEGWQPGLAEISRERHWQNHPVPALGPIFQHPDDAARYAQQRTDNEILARTGYEGAVLGEDSGQRFVPLEPVAWFANEENLRLRLFRTAEDPATDWRRPAPRFPDGYAVVASHQFSLSGNTLLVADNEQIRSNFAEPALVYAHTHELKNQGFDIRGYYYSTPGHELLKYTPVYSDAERDLLLTRSVVYENGRWVSRLTPGQFVSRLLQLGEFQVLVAGAYWRHTGHLGSGWRIRRQQPAAEGAVRIRDEL
ncbi:DUF4329 domain-containing protein [Pseudomonas sp. GXM4]|uniref:DUF4329 domain-containing protein n=1 Tax=Pseudomonas sp. GXM4 TaxID=2651867 RepID=UPI00124F69D4|nr:DUF4329 domain-containing protein [Pseudomonas sp. GXM4]KAB2523600.1 DUF4329 domain-containing protein [Pseudomonas sp. GXM4]